MNDKETIEGTNVRTGEKIQRKERKREAGGKFVIFFMTTILFL
jgi:hypothetical protein